MEQENAISEANVKLDEIGIGEDKPQVEAKRVVIFQYEITMQKNRAGKEIGDKLTLAVEHPDMKDRKLEISGVKYQKGDKLAESGLWINQDADGKLPYKSAVATMLRFLKCSKISELPGTQTETIAAENGYLLIKAY